MPQIEVTTHSGDTEVVDVETYNATELVQEINNKNDEHVIALGNSIYSKIDIKSIKPVTVKE
ncbi:hypothetical protein ACEN4P_01400 [Marinilactibacillus psychrotolerans]|uniref:hypothetical protein n=1 Tax=Marinilactibacillus psychrotolerans TaxID=191770 RepID=UPI003887E852